MEHCDRNCGHCLTKLCAHGIPVFASLTRPELEKLSRLTVHRAYARGDVIVPEGGSPGFVAIVNEGSVKAARVTPDGREHILYVFSEGDFFGEQNLLFDRPSGYSAVALEPVRLCLLYREDFHALVKANPDIAVNIIGELGQRLMRLENAMQGMGARSLDVRVGAVLLELAGKYGSRQKDGVLLRLPFSREGLASYIGVARETVSRKLGQLEDEGVIRSVSSKTILIPDPCRLQETANP